MRRTVERASLKRALAVFGVVLLVVSAGCAGSGGSADSGGAGGAPVAQDTGLEATAAASGTPAASGDSASESYQDGSSPGQVDASVPANRALIFTGQIALTVDDYQSSQANLTEITNEYGGFVSDSSRTVRERGNETWTTGRVVIRVPRDNFTALFEKIQQEGKVQTAEKSSQDVTDQLVDLEARLENLKAERDRLRELYQRANETEDVLAVEQRLSEVQGEIERTEARLRNLENRVAYSTITVRLEEPVPDYQPDIEHWYDTGVLAAFGESIDGVVTTLRALVVGAAFVAPYAIVFGLPFVGVAVLLVRRHRNRR